MPRDWPQTTPNWGPHFGRDRRLPTGRPAPAGGTCRGAAEGPPRGLRGATEGGHWVVAGGACPGT
eukprot:6204007-Alexandrium_andersonii.AAC.1